MIIRKSWPGAMGALSACSIFVAGCPAFAPNSQTGTDHNTTHEQRELVIPADASIPDLLAFDAGATGDSMFPPAPTEAVLCMLRFKLDSLEEVKKRFGTPEAEAMERTNATLSYRFRGAVSLYLSFTWSDGKVSFSDDVNDDESRARRRGYLLKEASITGLPYPACWPHEEAED